MLSLAQDNIFGNKTLRLCEEARQYGVGKLSLAGVLSVIADPSAKDDDIGRRVLNVFQPSELPNVPQESLMALCGLTAAQAAPLRAALDLFSRLRMYENKVTVRTPEDVARLLDDLRYKDREHLMVVCLNSKNGVIRIATVSVGTVNASLAHPRECFKPAVMVSAVAVIFAHNHPSGDPTPSSEDMQLTKQLKSAADVLGIDLLDHLVIGDGVWVSLKERGQI